MPTPFPKTTVSLAVLAALGLGAAAFSFGRTQAAPAVVAPSTVAVVDVRTAMRLIKEAEAVKNELKAASAQAQAEGDKRQKAIDAMVDKSKVMTQGSAEYKELHSQWTEALMQFEVFQKVQQDKLVRLGTQAELSLYRKVCARAAQMAAAKGYDILLDNTFPADALDKVSLDRMQASKAPAAVDRFLGGDRTLLYVNKASDLTNDLVAVMNNEFNQRGGLPAAQPGPLAPAGPIGPTVPAKPQ